MTANDGVRRSEAVRSSNPPFTKHAQRIGLADADPSSHNSRTWQAPRTAGRTLFFANAENDQDESLARKQYSDIQYAPSSRNYPSRSASEGVQCPCRTTANMAMEPSHDKRALSRR